ncbi:DNA polymerase kappa [Hamiltosporidium tvaerminnensis]|uniref:DNA polymerase kappa n=1 Tax=Hamiltosporidium tvaerminnensis TaxID=1176355 RepID=A0A4Q9LZQ7_9MICR|nr:DNA polymerase kappa [Hamiltosporidium tvaerminnensis]
MKEKLKTSQNEHNKDKLDYFDENEENKIINVRKKALNIKTKLEKISSVEVEGAKQVVEKFEQKLRIEWPVLFGENPKFIFVYVDLDSFYASVEMLKNKSLHNVPLAVGGNAMICACNYKAREYKVKAGMPGYIAKNLCPTLLIIKPNMEKYNYYSEIIMGILSKYDKNLEMYGIDEACLSFDKDSLNTAYNILSKKTDLKKKIDFENSCVLFTFENICKIVEEIRNCIFDTTGLTISAGISVCRGLAKLSSKVNKPNGQFCLKNNFQTYLNDLDVDELNGIGKRTKELLVRTFNLKKVKELQENIHLLYLSLKMKTFNMLFRLSYGLSIFDGLRPVSYTSLSKKSINKEYSFKATNDYIEIMNNIYNISKYVSKKMQKNNYLSFLISVKIKFSDFNSFTIQRQCKVPIKTIEDIFDTVIDLLTNHFSDKSIKQKLYESICNVNTIRLIGIKVSSLIKEKNFNLIQKYTNDMVICSERLCPICNLGFFNESNFIFESHVNICLDKQQTEKRNINRTLLKFFKSRNTEPNEKYV